MIDTVWFVKVIDDTCVDHKNTIDDYGNKVADGVYYIAENFFEYLSDAHNKKTYKLSKKVPLFYKECIVYPFVNITEGKKGYEIANNDFTDILYYVEQNGFSHL